MYKAHATNFAHTDASLPPTHPPPRHNAFTVANSLSLVAAVTMLRSSLTAQRVAAARLLSHILKQAAPSRATLDINGTLTSLPVVELGHGEVATRATWHDVWTSLVEELDVAAALCAALDETARPQASAAAMDAIAALLDSVGPPDPFSTGHCRFPACCWGRDEAGSAWVLQDQLPSAVASMAPRVVKRAVEALGDEQLVQLHGPALHMLARYVADCPWLGGR